jgi:ABC-type Mn2+/Zn2+ transport system permease subunit
MFSFMLGLTFLGIGLVENSRSEMLGLLWGSILFVQKKSVIAITVIGLLLVLFSVLFNKEMKVLLFSRSIASATGVHEGVVYCLFLALCGITLSVNLQIIGGLMIFSLITNPAAAAYQICKGHKAVVITSMLFGILSTVAGFFLSFLAGIPFTIGASASICGLIGAILYYGKSRGGFYGEAIYKQAMGWIIGIVIFGLLVPGINNWAHGGGVISGILLAFLMGYHENKNETSMHRAFATGCILLTILSCLWAVLQATYHQFT